LATASAALVMAAWVMAKSATRRPDPRSCPHQNCESHPQVGQHLRVAAIQPVLKYDPSITPIPMQVYLD